MNLSYGLATPAADGVGAARDVSASGRTKTFMVTGTMVGTVTVEASNDGTSYFPVFSMTGVGKKTMEMPCQWLRTRISGYVSGQAAVDVVATDDGIKTANLPVSAGDGTGTAVDISEHGTTTSILVGGTWTGVVMIEISEDGTDWSQLEGFARPGLRVRGFITNFIRVRRQGGSTGTPNVDIASANDDNPETNLFGDGIDGDVTLAAPLTLARDMYYDTLDVADQEVQTAGFRIFCKTECRIGNAGVIHNDGNDGAAEVGGAAIGANMLGASSAGGNGQAAGGLAGGALAQCIGGEGGAGGAGTGGAGAAAGAKTALATDEASPQAVPINILPIDPVTGNRYTGGTGGGGGGGDGVADEGGGGGGGGGPVVIVARKINLQYTTSQIRAQGGAGADGTAADCGGGGGGGGGPIILVYRTIDNQGTISSAGGDGGASGGGTGVAGTAGDAGDVYLCQV